MYYRVSSNNVGVYQAFKEMTNRKKWHKILKLSKWLPEPPNYKDECRSYFTEKGFEKFMLTVFPVMKISIDIEIEQFKNLSAEIIYADEYQVVILV